MIRDVLLLQQKDVERVLAETCVRRTTTIIRAENPGKITLLTGPRRSGKTFTAIRHLSRTGSGEFGYIDLGDERLSGLADPDTILAAIDSVYGKQKTLLLDGIANLPAWEAFVDRLAREEYDLVITDSSQALLTSGPATGLTGRYLRTIIFPFSFCEYLALVPQERNPQAKLAALHEYAESGGFSEPLIKKIPGREYCRALFDSIVYKDIIRRYPVHAVQVMADLALYLLASIATEYSYQSLARAMRSGSTTTIIRYLGILEESFLFFSIPRFSKKVPEQFAANRKIYCTDNGFVTARGLRAPECRGRLYENLVAIELRKRQLQGSGSVGYWKTAQGEDLDFVVLEEGMVTSLIQVCAGLADGKAGSRKVRALLKASRDLSCDNLLILSEEEEKTEEAEWFGIKGTIRYVPLWKWLENPQDRKDQQ